MKGPVALHGGGEFLPGDERFLRAILELAPTASGVVRVAVVPTAAARGRPDLAAANGVEAIRRVAVDAGIAVDVEAVRVVDPASAADPSLAETLVASTLIHLPGGDPDIIPTLYPGTAAWAAMERAHTAGAVLAGASAGAMALAAWTWTAAGGVRGLGLIPGIIVAPHADAASWARWVGAVHRGRAGGPRRSRLGRADRGHRPGDGAGPWRVVGEGEARWLPAGATEVAATVIARAGDTLAR